MGTNRSEKRIHGFLDSSVAQKENLSSSMAPFSSLQLESQCLHHFKSFSVFQFVMEGIVGYQSYVLMHINCCFYWQVLSIFEF